MTKVRLGSVIILMIFLGFSAQSCKNSNKESSEENTMHSDKNLDHVEHHDAMDSEGNETKNAITEIGIDRLIANYISLKDALVATDNEKAKMAGKQLEETLHGFSVSQYSAEDQKKLNDILTDARKNAGYISESEMPQQREHFKVLSKDMLDMVAITGASQKIYELYCPMYDRGSSWLSLDKEIKNPYYGSKMINCGNVRNEIN